jgi:hypothetical protein
MAGPRSHTRAPRRDRLELDDCRIDYFPKKPRRISRPGDQLDPVSAYEFVEREKATYSVVTLCRVLGILGCLPQWLLGLAQARPFGSVAG